MSIKKILFTLVFVVSSSAQIMSMETQKARDKRIQKSIYILRSKKTSTSQHSATTQSLQESDDCRLAEILHRYQDILDKYNPDDISDVSNVSDEKSCSNFHDIETVTETDILLASVATGYRK